MHCCSCNLSDHRVLSRHDPAISPGPTWPPMVTIMFATNNNIWIFFTNIFRGGKHIQIFCWRNKNFQRRGACLNIFWRRKFERREAYWNICWQIFSEEEKIWEEGSIFKYLLTNISRGEKNLRGGSMPWHNPRSASLPRHCWLCSPVVSRNIHPQCLITNTHNIYNIHNI